MTVPDPFAPPAPLPPTGLHPQQPWAPGPWPQLPVDKGLALVIPIGRTGLSIAAGYAGLVSLVLWFLAPIGLGLSVAALLQLSRRPDRLGRGRAWFGLVSSVVGLAGLGVIAVLALSRSS